MNSTDVTVTQEPFALKIILRFFYIVIFLVGLCGNLLVCIVVVQQRRMRTVINYFTLNLAVSDLIFILTYLPSQMAAFENNQNWLLGNIGCRIIYSIAPVCMSSSIATLLAISCERFRGIVFPFQPRLKHATVRGIIVSIWLVSTTTALPLMFVAGTVVVGDNVFCDETWPSTFSSRFYWISMFLVQYVIPLFAMIVLYGVAGWKLQTRTFLRSRGRHDTVSSVNSQAETARQRQSQKITKMLVALILLYSFCMLPQHIIYFWRTYGDFQQWEYDLYVFRISNLFPMANSALNSIAYGTLQADFRKAYKNFFKKYNLCVSVGRCEKSNDGKNLKRRNAVGKRNMTEKGPLEKSFKPTNSVEIKRDRDAATLTGAETKPERVSSDSRSCLISGESTNTSESQASKPDDYETQGDPLVRCLLASKMRTPCSQIQKTTSQIAESVETGTARAQVLVINKDTGNERLQLSDNIDNYGILGTDIEIADIFSLESAKETIL